MRVRQLLGTVAMLALFGAGVPPAHGADEGTDDAWHFEVTPYMWLPEIQGRVTAAGAGGQSVSTSLHIGIDDSLKLLFKGQLWGGMGYFEARKRRLSLFLDVIGVHAEEDQTVTGRSLGRGVFRNPDRTTKIAVFTDVIMTEFGAMYRVLDLPRRSDRMPSISIDALAGGRYLHSANDTDVRSTSLLGPVGAEASNTADIVDPFFGGRWAVGLRDDLVLGFRGDVGGFDAGTHFTWQIAGSLRYRVPFTLYATPLWANLGYRVLDFDIRNTAPCVNARINLQLRGPFAGVVGQF